MIRCCGVVYLLTVACKDMHRCTHTNTHRRTHRYTDIHTDTQIHVCAHTHTHTHHQMLQGRAHAHTHTMLQGLTHTPPRVTGYIFPFTASSTLSLHASITYCQLIWAQGTLPQAGDTSSMHTHPHPHNASHDSVCDIDPADYSGIPTGADKTPVAQLTLQPEGYLHLNLSLDRSPQDVTLTLTLHTSHCAPALHLILGAT